MTDVPESWSQVGTCPQCGAPIYGATTVDPFNPGAPIPQITGVGNIPQMMVAIRGCPAGCTFADRTTQRAKRGGPIRNA